MYVVESGGIIVFNLMVSATLPILKVDLDFHSSKLYLYFKIVVFCVVTPCGIVGGYQCSTCCLDSDGCSTFF
jgi:hypothetical protein